MRHYEIGERIKFTLTDPVCWSCGRVHPHVDWFTYIGHRFDEYGDVYDVYLTDAPCYCPDCGAMWTGWALPCNEGGYWLESDLFSQKQPEPAAANR